jgi:hypothetical protein
VGLGPVSLPWANQIMRGLPATLERLRIDRQLEEAFTHRADPLHLPVVFDLHESTAIRYAASARQLLERPHEAEAAGTNVETSRPPEQRGLCPQEASRGGGIETAREGS